MDQVLLHERLVDTSLRYEQKTAALCQTAIILLQSQVYSPDHDDMEENFRKLGGYLSTYDLSIDHFFAGMLLTNLITEVENFLIDVTQAILLRYPKKLGNIQFKLSDIMDKSREEIVGAASEQYLNKLMYKKPNEYLLDLCKVLSIDEVAVRSVWPYYVEIKARRDLGTHNKWQKNDTYIRKITDIGLDPDNYQGPQMCPDHNYLFEAMDHCDLIVRTIGDLLVRKYPMPKGLEKDT